ncbi:glyoxylate/hydroxypyruvate reductase GhrA [Acerihabitans arboris]|uniref:Glyoxylate/hydroxypyruvate reductase GhrA n=1 Tax=Acerihabitans arboris TaxID=2691583 RepID=A0A845SMW2_9GAMM|nr:glyoxylate/hydroxypyruvate reductase GhrA [Acerihabitans arboris]NDL62585.1 glyoxylate/hydroxypyruvate reductase GhrA [Acerihabitans arboris]
MNIIFFHPAENAAVWLDGLRRRLPGAQIRRWREGDTMPADYALVWHPPTGMLAGRTGLKGVFALGAGVDALMDQLRLHPHMLPEDVPLLRLEDTGMAQQMVEYVIAAVLRYYRRLDEYALQQRLGEWRELAIPAKDDFVIGITGAGVLGRKVAMAVNGMGFPVRCWSRSVKVIPGVISFAGQEGLDDFLSGVQVLVNLLPNTPHTTGILDAALFARLNKGAFIINIARGAHLVESDLLDAMAQGHIAAATLDVSRQEPPPADHPFWTSPRIAFTPHIAAMTLPELAMDSIADNIRRIENGHLPRGRVDRHKGY